MSNYKDLEKRRETQKKWNEANKDRLRESRRKYHREYQRKRRQNPELWEKEKEDRKQYYYRNQEESKQKSREYMRKYYRDNNELFAKRSKEQYEKKKEWFKKFLSTLQCEQCGERDTDCLDFHHIQPNGTVGGRRVDPPVTSLMSRSKKVILEESKKCSVLCANCHRREHARLREF